MNQLSFVLVIAAPVFLFLDGVVSMRKRIQGKTQIKEKVIAGVVTLRLPIIDSGLLLKLVTMLLVTIVGVRAAVSQKQSADDLTTQLSGTMVTIQDLKSDLERERTRITEADLSASLTVDAHHASFFDGQRQIPEGISISLKLGDVPVTFLLVRAPDFRSRDSMVRNPFDRYTFLMKECVSEIPSAGLYLEDLEGKRVKLVNDPSREFRFKNADLVSYDLRLRLRGVDIPIKRFKPYTTVFVLNSESLGLK